MDKQAVYDAVRQHAVKQGSLAIEGDYCRYRTTTGKKCFIGALIPNSAYTEGMEGVSIGHTRDGDIQAKLLVEALDANLILSGWRGYKEMEFLGRIQGCHDNQYCIADAIRDLGRVATYHGLTVPT